MTNVEDYFEIANINLAKYNCIFSIVIL